MKNLGIVIFFFVVGILSGFAQTNRVLICGISEYKYLPLSDDLMFDKRDVKLLQHSFINQKIAGQENIFLLLDEQVTKYNVILGLVTLIENSQPGDNIIFYFSGYADVASTADSAGYLLCYEATEEGFYSGSDAIRSSTLKKITEFADKKNVRILYFFNILADKKLVGGDFGYKKSFKYLSENWNNAPKFFAKDTTQIFSNSNNRRYSLFAYFISKSLTLNSKCVDNDTLYLEKFINFVTSNVSRESNHEQTPVAVFFDKQKNLAKITKKSTVKTTSIFYDLPQEFVPLISQFQTFLQKQNFYAPVEKSKISKIILTQYGDIPAFRATVCASAHRIIVADTFGFVSVYSANDSINFISKRKLHKGGIKSIVAYDKDVVVTGSWDNHIKIYDYANDSILDDVAAHKNDVECLAISPDKKLLASGSYDRTVKIWSLQNYQMTLLQELSDHHSPVNVMQFVDNQYIISSDISKKTIFWEKKNNKFYQKIVIRTDGKVVDIAYLNNEFYLADNKGFLYTYDIKTLKLKKKEQVLAQLKQLEVLDFPMVGTYLAVVGKNTIKFVAIGETPEIDNISLPFSVNILVKATDKDLFAFSNLKQAEVAKLQFVVKQKNTNTSAYQIWYLANINETLTDVNKQRFSYLFFSSLFNYVNATAYPFIAGSFIKPDISQIDEALFYLKLMDNYVKNYDFLITESEKLRLILETYRSLLLATPKTLNEALKKADTLQKVVPYAAFTFKQKAQINTEMNNFSLAEQNILYSSERLPGWSENNVCKGNILLKKGEFDDAIDEYQKIVKQVPQNTKGYMYLSLTFAQMNNLDSAEKYIDIAYSKNSSDASVINQKADIQLKRLQIQKARKFVGISLNQNSRYIITKILEAIVTNYEHNYRGAEIRLLKLMKDSSLIEPYYLLSNLFLSVGNTQLAKKYADEGYRIAPDNSDVLLSNAKIYAFKYLYVSADYNDGAKSLFFMNKAIDKTPYYYKVYLQKAVFFNKLFYLTKNHLVNDVQIFSFKDTNKFFTDSVKYYLTKAEKYSPDNFDIKLEYAKFYKTLGKTGTILEMIADLEKNKTQDPATVILLSKLYVLAGNYKQAENIVKKLLKTFPENYQLLDQLFKVYLHTNNLKNFQKIQKKYIKSGASVWFLYYYETLKSLNTGKYNFTVTLAKYKKFFYAIVAKDNIAFLYNKKTSNSAQVWNIKRLNAVQHKWIIFESNGKKGLMFFNGQILIPANFDKIEYVGSNIFQCYFSGKIYKYSIGIDEVQLLEN